ncbi:MAG: 50S ribosomal protein L1 [Candidatus Aenigmarchaeota archaeon]|nr:50S ribosomal protein L1 [Candidatus Aenigmarchaeota archaeon]
MKRFLNAIQKAKSESRERKFSQTWDMSIELRGMDMKKPESKLNLEVPLPEGRGKDIKIIFIADSLTEDAKRLADKVLTKPDIEKLSGKKKEIRKLATEYDSWLAEAPLMPLVGKALGMILAPRGQMPKPVPPKAKIDGLVSLSRRVVKIKTKDTPVVHAPVGTDKMTDEQIAKNALHVFNMVSEKLPKGRNNVKSVHVKLTMGKSVKVEL